VLGMCEQRVFRNFRGGTWQAGERRRSGTPATALMPKFGFYMQDALRWAEPDDKTHPGHDIGCHLALRKSAGGDSEVYIKKIVPGGPVALSAALATGDVIAEIDGINPLEAKDGSQTLHTLLEGELGTAVWLKVRGAHHVPLIRSKALKVKPQGSSHAGLGFSYRELLTVDPDGGVLVTAVHPGGALWLHGQIYRDSVSLRSGDIITHVDGKPVGADSAFKGEPFSRVRIAGKRADSGSGFEIDVIRAETLANRWLQQVEDYRKAVECIPPAPPSDRVNANSGIQIMSAPLINGLDINTAARVCCALCSTRKTAVRLCFAVLLGACQLVRLADMRSNDRW